MTGGLGLTQVKTQDLKKALLVVHQGHMNAPLSLPELTRCGLQHCADHLMGALRDVDTAGLRAVLVCVLAERLEQERQQLQQAQARLAQAQAERGRG